MANIAIHPNENRFRITQEFVATDYYQRMKETYYDQWGIKENNDPIERNALFLTYRIYDPDRPLEPMLERFRKFNHWQLKRMIGEKRSTKYVYERQHVGMVAVDYNGSSAGKWVPAEGSHIHSVIVIHPELRSTTMVWFAMLHAHYGDAFYYERLSDSGRSIHNSIHYCLKGVMHANGYYRDRDDLSIFIGPRKEKFQSQVVRVGRVPILNKPIFKLKGQR